MFESRACSLLQQAWVREHCSPSAAAERRASAEAVSKPTTPVREQSEPTATMLAEEAGEPRRLAVHGQPTGGGSSASTGSATGEAIGRSAIGHAAMFTSPMATAATAAEAEGGQEMEVEAEVEAEDDIAEYEIAEECEAEEGAEQQPQPHWWCDVAGDGCVRPEQPTHNGQYDPHDRCWAHPDGHYIACDVCYASGEAEHMGVLRLLEADDMVASQLENLLVC